MLLHLRLGGGERGRLVGVGGQAHLAAQGKLLAAAQNSLFELQSQVKMDAPKVQRLRDYEKRIEQFTEMHRLWYVAIPL